MKLGKYKLMLFAVASLVLASCEKEETRTVATTTQSALTASTTTLVLQQANANNNAVTFTWTAASFGYDAAITYSLQLSKAGTGFASATTTEIPLDNSFSKTFKVVDFNREMLKIVLYGSPQQVEARVKSSVGPSETGRIYSNTLAMTVTPYRDVITYSYPAALNVAGNYQGWNPGTAPQIVNAGNGGYTNATNTRFEGYINFTDPSPQFKFVKGNDWPFGDYGSAGPGLLGNGGPNLALTNGAGIYRIRANTTSLTWENVKINTWGIIGDATPNGWNSDQDMTYNAGPKTFSITLNLVAGFMKFRANDDWAINFGDNNGDFKPEYDGANISIPLAGNYTLTLDVSVGGNYAYTIKKN